MNRATNGREAQIQPPLTWTDDEYAGLWANTADTLDDRVSEDIFDAEDERAEVEIMVHGTMRA
jgi:hypothetical protein